MEIHLIWAQDSNGGIGIDGKLPWRISEDLKNFKKITSNSTIIMGRKTWDSLPFKPLPNRRNIVLSRTNQNQVETYTSYEQCITKLKEENVKKIFVIGGRSIYKLFFTSANFLHMTKIDLFESGINEFFPIKLSQIRNDFIQISERKIALNARYTLWNKKIIINYKSAKTSNA